MHTKTVNGRTTAWSGGYDVTVKSNYRERELVTYAELPASEQQWFDYMLSYTGEAAELEHAAPRFFQFRGSWYDAQEFERVGDSFKALGWDSWQPESAFSAVLLRWFDADGYELEGVVVGYAHW